MSSKLFLTGREKTVSVWAQLAQTQHRNALFTRMPPYKQPQILSSYRRNHLWRTVRPEFRGVELLFWPPHEFKSGGKHVQMFVMTVSQQLDWCAACFGAFDPFSLCSRSVTTHSITPISGVPSFLLKPLSPYMANDVTGHPENPFITLSRRDGALYTK